MSQDNFFVLFSNVCLIVIKCVRLFTFVYIWNHFKLLKITCTIFHSYYSIFVGFVNKNGFLSQFELFEIFKRVNMCNFISSIMIRTSHIPWDNVHFVLDQHAYGSWIFIVIAHWNNSLQVVLLTHHPNSKPTSSCFLMLHAEWSTGHDFIKMITVSQKLYIIPL